MLGVVGMRIRLCLIENGKGIERKVGGAGW